MGASERLRTLRSLAASAGPAAAGMAVLDRLVRPRATCWSAVVERVRDRSGLEIGGPSSRFADGGVLPLYAEAAALDNTTFASRTIWEGELDHEFAFHPGRRPGKQHFFDATDLGGLDDGAYDFVLSSHVLEHLANPIKAVLEWKRVVRPGGCLVLVVPHGARTFDRARPITMLDHLIEDFERDLGEDDKTHFDEVIRLHDLRRDPQLRSREELAARTADNGKYRAVHHHVFDLDLLRDVLEYAVLTLAAIEFKRPFDIIALADRGP